MTEKVLNRLAVLLRQAALFLSFGWQIVRIPPRQKAPNFKGWQNSRLTENDLEDVFKSHDNIGVLLGSASNGLTDVDLDCDQAIVIADRFLPPTNRISGRDSRPDSHWWFVVDTPVSPMKFTDSDGEVLVELRSTGQQTLIPPSIHPSGENLYWKLARRPGRVQAGELQRAVRWLAVCALVARHWPKRGSRHELTLALAGFLLRGGLPVEQVENVVTAAAFASMTDEEWKSRRHDIKSTLNRLEKGLPATGVPKLAALLGDEVISKIVEWLGLSPGTHTTPHQPIPVSWPEPPKDVAFRGFAGEIVSMIEPHSESDPVALLSQLLVGFGNMIGRKAHFQVEADRHSANLFVVLVGATSKARKGSALSHIKRLLREVDAEWIDDCMVSGLSSGQGLIYAVRDPTYSKDGEKVLDAGAQDKRLLAIETEFAQQLKLMAQDTNILSTVIRQAWDSGDLRTLTKTSPVRATGAHVSIVGHVTVQELRRYLNQTELGNGFANRILWLCVKRSKVLPEGGRLNDHDLLDIIERLRATIDWARTVKKMTRSAHARQLWAEIYPELSEGSAGLLGAVTSRAEAQVTRLSIIYALLDRSSVIKTQHLRAALAFWDYAEASARFIFGDSLGDPVADDILRALRVNPSGLTRTDISNLFGGHRKGADISRALVVLAQSGLASPRSEATGGRPDERWSVLAEGAKNAKKE